MGFVLLGILNSQAAAGGGGEPAYDLIQTTVLTSGVNGVTFDNLDTIAADYKHLQIRMTARSDWSSAFNNDIFLTFNSDTATNYAWHWLYGDGNAVFSGQESNNANMRIKIVVPSANVDSNVFGAGVVDILDFSSTNKNTTIRSLNGTAQSSEFKIVLNSGFWNNTNALTTMTLTSSNGDYISGSRFSLYGIKG